MIRCLFLIFVLHCVLSQSVCVDKSFFLRKSDVEISSPYLGTEKWMPFQRRVNDSVDFYRGAEDYALGFGSVDGSFWLGLDNIHELTKKETKLLIVMEKFGGEVKYAKYDKFKVDGCDNKYQLHVSGYSGDAGDSFSVHDKMYFTTKDRDNDIYPLNCATSFMGAWWYRDCHHSNLNGLYLGEGTSYGTGVQWGSFTTDNDSLKSVRMMLAL